MKRNQVPRGTKAILFCVLIATFETSLGRAEPQHSFSYSWHWTYRKIQVPANDMVRVSLPDLTPNTRYVAGFRCASVPMPTFVIGEVHPGKQVSKHMWMISGVDNWPADEVKVMPESIQITGVATSSGWLIVYGELPSGMRVEVHGPHGLIASGKVQGAGTLLIRDGITIGEHVLGMRTLMGALMYPSAYEVANTEPILVREGTYFVTPAGLAKHMLAFVRPTYPPGIMPDHDGTMASLLLIIGPDGRVQEVQKVDGDPVALSVCARAIEQWRFSPFTADEAPVTVHAPLRFVFAKDGSVVSPILNAMAGR